MSDPAGSIPIRFADHSGPTHKRFAMWLVGFSLMFVSWVLFRESMKEFAVAAFAAAFVMPSLLNHIISIRKPKHAVAHLLPGKLKLQSDLLFSQTIKPKQIQGATTAIIGGEVLVVLQVGTRLVGLYLPDNDAARRVWKHLGMGYRGVGRLQWRHPITVEHLPILFLMMGAMIPFWVLGLAIESAPLGVLAMAVISLSIWPLVSAKSALCAEMYDTGFVSRLGNEWVPYNQVKNIEKEDTKVHVRANGKHENVYLETSGGIAKSKVPEEQVNWLMLLLEAAQRRAQRDGGRPESVNEMVRQLGEQSKQDPQWTEKLDMVAATMNRSAYRGLSLDEQDLWQALENPDASGYERAVAARVLVTRNENAKVRVQESAQSVREVETEKLIRQAVES
jgi:hypothetical protein